jgi:ATP-dependent Zn protease
MRWTLGVTEQLPVDERRLYSESYLLESLAVRLGGRASENLVVGEAPTGAPQFGQERPYAGGTQQLIDEEVSRLLTEAEDGA